MTQDTKLLMALRQVSLGAIRGFMQPYMTRALYSEARNCVAVPVDDMAAAIEGALETQAARIGEAEKVIEPFAEAAELIPDWGRDHNRLSEYPGFCHHLDAGHLRAASRFLSTKGDEGGG